MTPLPRKIAPRLARLAVLPAVLAGLVAVAAPVGAEGDPGRGFGLGVMAGEPTGLNFKAWTNERNAFVGGAAWSFTDPSSFTFHVDYHFHQFDWLTVEEGRLPVYFGIGGRIKFADESDDLIGIRMPIGLDYLVADAPLDFFVELVPVLDLTPSTEIRLNAAVGGRYFF